MSLHNLLYFNSDQESYITGSDNVEIAYFKNLIFRIKPPGESPFMRTHSMFLNKWKNKVRNKFTLLNVVPEECLISGHSHEYYETS